MDKPSLKIVPDDSKSTFDLARFKSSRPPGSVGVVALVTALPVHKISEAKDFVRVADESLWTPELCFVNVPVKGQRAHTLHLIDEEIALTFIPNGDIQRFKLALAAKPYDEFFLVVVPSQNLDNTWNKSNLEAIEIAQKEWVRVTSLKLEGNERYQITRAKDVDAFPEPKWPKQTTAELVQAAFQGRTIESDQDDALKRLTGSRLGP